MTPEQIMLVQSSWSELEPMQNKFGEYMYKRVFELDPGLRTHFSGDEAEHGRVIMSMIGSIVHMLFTPAVLEASLNELGRRHVNYGCARKDYATFRQALDETLANMLGPGYTDDMREAWMSVYDYMGEKMLEKIEAG